ncbi:uncharacterized protein LOC111240742 [Vigna radiata var. radiata]|uniref:Uncharacterized protein LOC111240742 n=1 Tax=Vigna radiata var. radiata TaxID=3916 RepID=A0A3Q0ENV7_VIGRR|nr:uncharacterized protein LOC111240742 [Vigna radiata var. radiata]
MQHSTGSVKRLGAKPTCFCGQNAVFRIARTPKNKGKKFWGCPNFKGGNDELVGCNFFEWCLEEGNQGVVEERSAIARAEEVGLMSMEESYLEKMRMASMEKTLLRLEKWFKILVGMMFVNFIFNLILVSLLLKVG